jgi:hypothetical protein
MQLAQRSAVSGVTFLMAGALGLAVTLGACNDSADGDGAGGSGANGSGPSGPGSTGVGGSSGVGGGPPMFETDIVPIFNKSCGATDGSCHAAVAYFATVSDGCRGWLSLENKPLGSMFDNPQTGMIDVTGCPDMELYRRLLDLDSWEECNGEGVRYVVPCDPDASYLWHKIQGTPLCGLPDSKKMPPDVALSPVEAETLRLWILAGAPRTDGTVDACANPTTSSTGVTTGGMGQAPVPTITHPADGDSRPANLGVPLIGNATDAEDGALPDSALVWSSDLDGPLGTGNNLTVTLSAGQHLLSLEVTDSDGNVGTDSLNLTMTP